MIRERETNTYFEAAETFRDTVGETIYSSIAIVGAEKWEKYEDTLPQKTRKLLKRYGIVVESLLDIDDDVNRDLDWIDYYMAMEEPDAQDASDASMAVAHRIDVQLMAQFLRRNYIPFPLSIHTYLEQYFPNWERGILGG